jgi:hypothetical protein
MVAAVFVLALNNARPFPNSRFFDFPLAIGDWSGHDVKMSDYVYQLIETKYLFLREYQSPRYNEPVNLSIVWFAATDISFHAPEALPGRKWDTKSKKKHLQTSESWKGSFAGQAHCRLF